MSHLLFGTPGDWCSRHPQAMLGCALALIALSQYFVDAATGVVLP